MQYIFFADDVRSLLESWSMGETGIEGWKFGFCARRAFGLYSPGLVILSIVCESHDEVTYLIVWAVWCMSFLLEGVVAPVMLLLLDMPGPIKDTVECFKDVTLSCFTPREASSAQGRASKARRELLAAKAAARAGREIVKGSELKMADSDDMATKTMAEVSKLFTMYNSTHMYQC